MRSSVFYNSRPQVSLALTAIAIVFATIHSPAIAREKQPIADDLPPTTGGQSAGSRGCGIQAQDPLELVIPPLAQTYTHSRRPTFAWTGNSQSQTSVEFRLLKYDPTSQSAQLVHELKNPPIQEHDGLSILQWPQALAPLQPDVQYIWQVELVCDPSRPSGNIFADAPIKVLPIGTELQKAGYDTLKLPSAQNQQI